MATLHRQLLARDVEARAAADHTEDSHRRLKAEPGGGRGHFQMANQRSLLRQRDRVSTVVDEVLPRQRGQFGSLNALLREDAYKRDLLDLLLRPQAPSILFTASHGAEYDIDDSRQTQFQGALVMRDWEGGSGPVAENQCFSGEDIQTGTGVAGMISLHFACFGAGTPDGNSFYGLGGRSGSRARA
ncbi:MAG: hypothetical protein SGI92_26520 [Bryobacteraceae bacterium]|nr:hypothetical protein [Bryobacteraceae bacterium]